MNYILLLIAVIALLSITYYIKEYTNVFTKLKARWDNDTNQDCLFTEWSDCDATGHQRRDILINKKGKGDVCEPLVRTCRQKATKHTWELCKSSDECIGADKFCHVGDNRCMTDVDCKWSNDTDGTTRDCTRL